MTQKRDPTADIAKGIGILLVVIGHLKISEGLHSLIYMFHMQLFFFMSAIFFHKRTTYLRFLSTDIKRLLIPYIIFTIIFYPIQIYKDLQGLDGTMGGVILASDFKPSITNRPLWFLLVLFILRSLTYVYEKVLISVRVKKIVAIILSFIGYGVVIHNPELLPESISRTIIALGFWFCGYFYGKGALDIKMLNSRCDYLIYIASLIMLTVGVLLNHSSDIMLLRIDTNPLWFYGCALSGIVLTLYISKTLRNQRNGIGESLSYVGRNTLYIFGLHWPLISVLQYWMNGIIPIFAQFMILFFVTIFSLIMGKVLNFALPSVFPKIG